MRADEGKQSGTIYQPRKDKTASAALPPEEAKKTPAGRLFCFIR